VQADTLVAEADLFLRVGREYQRAEEAARVERGVVLLNRFVISVLARVRVAGRDVALFTSLLHGAVHKACVTGTVYVACPFPVAWERVQQGIRTGTRRPSPQDKRGREYNERLYHFPWADFERGELTGERWRVDNSGSLEEAQRQLEEQVLPRLPPA
jgi:thymidylate kinase